METRVTHLWWNDQWIVIPFDHLKKGDSFRLYEEDGTIVEDEAGHNIFKATSDPYTDESGALTIDCECELCDKAGE